LVLGGPARHVRRALLAAAVVPDLRVLDLGSLDEALAVEDRREVAEDVLSSVVRLDEAEALVVPEVWGEV
jgi:hypothetical protein